ncbi:uncharacterized protein SPSC_04923 [Sporisorium scitamineum]|uniref:Uncharacterized protein n=1 Tax=Sporisorium scitamineum TaxID=49012 RepID=A0A127ZG44_9BASI|nr:uncharacterized protein SPSC_04923 [Sporisorium scitamineum]
MSSNFRQALDAFSNDRSKFDKYIDEKIAEYKRTTQDCDNSNPPILEPSEIPCSRPTLPPETIYEIIRLAASTDHRTAHACAYVSKTICKWTASDRWRTIVITTGAQFESLWRILHRETAAMSSVRAPRPPFSSLPSCLFPDTERLHEWTNPALFVENLFIDTRSSQYQRPIRQLKRSHPRHDSHGFLGYFKHLHYLAVGPNEVAEFGMSVTRKPKKVMLTTDDPYELKTCLDSMGLLCRRFRTCYRYTEKGLPVLRWVDINGRLSSLHIVSDAPPCDPMQDEIPVDHLRILRRAAFSFNSPFLCCAIGREYPPLEDELRELGYIAQASDRADMVNSPSDNNRFSRIPTNKRELDDFDRQAEQGCRRIRYDMLGLSTVASDKIAADCRHFFEELTTTRTNSSSELANPWAITSDASSEENSGVTYRDEPDADAGPTAKKAVLQILGCNRFEQLHICWQPVPGSAHDTEMGVPQQKAEVDQSATADHQDSSSACAEEQSCQSATQHLGSLESWTIATECKESVALRQALQDAFTTKYGWTQQDQDGIGYSTLDPYKQRFMNGLDAFITEYHARIANSSLCTDPIAKLPPAAGERVTVRMVPRAERLRLGGMYVPLTEEQGVEWFLANLETDDA